MTGRHDRSERRKAIRAAADWIVDLALVLGAVAAGTVIGDLAVHF